MYFFISTITGANPLHAEATQYAAGDDDAAAYDDAVVYDDDYSMSSELKIPGSAVVFQMVTSFIL